jgi:hypothetical protein
MGTPPEAYMKKKIMNGEEARQELPSRRGPPTDNRSWNASHRRHLSLGKMGGLR